MTVARARLKAEDGFTVVEALAAAVVVTVALLGAFLLLDVSTATSQATRERVGAINLAREITEDSRAIPWSTISPSAIVGELQAFPGLSNAGTGSAWQIQRDGFVYTVNATDCSVDDPKDGYGQHDSTFCPDSTVPTGAALTDPTPIDMKRVTAQVSWTALNSTHTVQEVATLTSAGEALGLQASGLQMASPLAGSTSPTIGPSTAGPYTFQVTAPPGATAIIWSVNGAAQQWTTGSTTSSSGVTFTGTWDITGLSDGTYKIGAAAEDGNGVIGPAVTIPVVLARGVPAAPDVPWYGFNTNLTVSGSSSPSTVVELQWKPNGEANVIGYRIYNPSAVLICSTTQSTSYQSCGASAWCSTPASCIDLSPPAPTASNLTYQVTALYKDASGTVQEGPRTSVTVGGPAATTYTFAPSTGNTTSNCTGTPVADMLGAYSPASTDSVALAPGITFCSDPFIAGAAVVSGGTATAYFANTGSACPVTATLSTDGSSTGAATATSTVPGSTSTPGPVQFTFAGGQLSRVNSGDRLDLNFSPSAGCLAALHYGSTGAPSVFQDGQLTPPSQPATLTAGTDSNGFPSLTWPASTSGAPGNFYRVYRDGNDYTHRYDTVPATDCTFGTCTWSDNKPGTATHTYYVTAVGGATAGSNMDESRATGPVTR